MISNANESKILDLVRNFSLNKVPSNLLMLIYCYIYLNGLFYTSKKHKILNKTILYTNIQILTNPYKNIYPYLITYKNPLNWDPKLYHSIVFELMNPSNTFILVTLLNSLHHNIIS